MQKLNENSDVVIPAKIVSKNVTLLELERYLEETEHRFWKTPRFGRNPKWLTFESSCLLVLESVRFRERKRSSDVDGLILILCFLVLSYIE